MKAKLTLLPAGNTVHMPAILRGTTLLVFYLKKKEEQLLVMFYNIGKLNNSTACVCASVEEENKPVVTCLDYIFKDQ